MKTRLEQLQELLADDPDDSFARYCIAMEFDKLGRLDEAAAQFRDLIDRDADYAAAYFMASKTLQKLGKIDDAREMLAGGIAAAKRSGDTHAAEEMTEALNQLEGQ
ncbi:MAG TPA: tetratricopeptide repeat protein [Phycisphaerae bacterium]|nr:tetratricopeptide repeat protein [Phycisphaerae bacterium]